MTISCLSAGPWSWAAGFVGYPIPNFPQSFWQEPAPPMNHAPRPTDFNFLPEAPAAVAAVPSPRHLRFSTKRRRGSNERPFRPTDDHFRPCDAHLRARGLPTRELDRGPSDLCSGTNIFLSPHPPLPPAKWRTCAPRPWTPLRRRRFQ